MDPTPPIASEALRLLARKEAARYARGRPKSRAALAAGAEAYLGGVPMHWMRDWSMPFPLVVDRAKAARLRDLDGYELDDFCLGDTGSMFGHSPKAVARAIAQQAGRGLTYMLPSQAAMEAGELLSQTFGPYLWQIATTASEANRYALRVARAVTGRPKVLVFHGSYHGTVDETLVMRDALGRTVNRIGLVGQAVDLSAQAVSVEFNDLVAVEAALKQGDIAAILTEPVMTNCAMVLPDPDFHARLQALADRYDALLILDETHTISSGLGGYGRVYNLRPDVLVVGKSVAGGVAAAVWGLSPAVAARFQAYEAQRPEGHSGMGTTLSANPLQFAALVATLRAVMTPAAYAHMDRGAARLAAGLEAVILRRRLPWHVVRVGARVEFICAPGPLRNGSQALAAQAPQIEPLLHMMLVNRGCLIAPFHNMMLVSPVTRKRQIKRLIAAFDEVTGLLHAAQS